VPLPTGVAASLLINGFTLHTLLAIPTERGTFGGTTPFGPLLATKLTEVQERLYGSEILLIDECSMVGSTMLGKVDRRLREVTGADVPFGGKGIVLMGDFFQLSAVGETSLPTAARICEETIVPAHTAYQLASLAMMGGQLFRQFRIIRFTQQMRINSDDVQHAALIEAFQQVDQSAESPITRQLLQQLERKYLTPVAIQQDPTWLHASIVVPTNEQRFLMTPYAMKHFAAQRGVPILRWRYPLPHQAVLTDNEIKILYERKPQLWAYFVPDAPVFITKNIAPTKGLANGTSARLHSISWDDEAYVEEVRLMQRHHRPGEVIDVRLPVSVNVEIPLSQLNHTSWTPTDKQTLVPGRAVLPLKQNCPTKIRMGKGYACPSFVLQQFSYELAFVVTFHKCQGRTMPKVILDLNKQPLAGTVGNVSYSGLYVGLSRVRKGVDVAIFPPVSYPGVGDRHAGAAGSLDHLLDLLPNHEFLSWWSGFDFETGQWSNERVKQATAHAIAAEKRRRKISRKARITTGRESDSRESQAQGAQANNASVFAAIHLQLTVSDSSLRPTSNHTAAAASGSASGPTTHAHHPTTGPSLGISMHMDLDGLVDMQGSLQLQENEWNAQGNDGVPEEQDEHMGVDDPDPQGPQNDLQWMPPAHVPPAVPIPTPNPNQNRNFPVDEDGDAIMTYLTR
jgi:hypothetical protein